MDNAALSQTMLTNLHRLAHAETRGYIASFTRSTGRALAQRGLITWDDDNKEGALTDAGRAVIA